MLKFRILKADARLRVKCANGTGGVLEVRGKTLIEEGKAHLLLLLWLGRLLLGLGLSCNGVVGTTSATRASTHVPLRFLTPQRRGPHISEWAQG